MITHRNAEVGTRQLEFKDFLFEGTNGRGLGAKEGFCGIHHGHVI